MVVFAVRLLFIPLQGEAKVDLSLTGGVYILGVAIKDVVDHSYRDDLRRLPQEKGNLKCSLSSALILRYLERIADHATYIGESVDYIVTGLEPST